METCLSRAITIVAMTGLLVGGAVATAILSGEGPMSLFQATSELAINPVSNREAKQDRLAVAASALAAYEPAQRTPAEAQLQAQAQAAIPDAGQLLRQAYAATTPADIGVPVITDPAITNSAPAAGAALPQKSKAATRPAPQKNYSLLSDAQIAGIKERLKLSASQEPHWPPVEAALRAVARKMHAKRQADPATGMQIDPDSEEVQKLKSAAMPLLVQLREDQKNEVRSLARIIGLDKVASMI